MNFNNMYPHTVKRGEIELITSGFQSRFPTADDCLTERLLENLLSSLNDLHSRKELTHTIKYKFLLNTIDRIGTMFNNLVKFPILSKPIQGTNSFMGIVAYTDTWEEEWMEVFRLFAIYGQGIHPHFDKINPYYGFNETLINAWKLMS